VNSPWRCLLLLSLSCLVGERTCRADPANGAARASVVEIVITGDARDTLALEQLVRELVAHLPVELEWSVSPAIDPRQVLARRIDDRHVLVRAWVDVSDERRAKIYVANGGSERFIVRFVPEPNGYDAVAREALGQIIESSIAAFVASSDAGIPRADALRDVAHEEPAVVTEPPKKPASRPEPPPRIDAGIAYQAGLLDGDTTQHGVTGVFGLALPGDRAARFASWANIGYRAPATWEGANAGVSVSGVAARIAAGVELDVTERFALRVVAGGGIDVVLIDPIAVTGATIAAPSSSDVVPILTAMTTGQLRLGGKVALFAGLGCDFDLSRPRYDVVREQGLTPAWTPWVAHPTVLAGFLVGFGGPRL
jgi:hypothetical protein